MKIQEIKNLNTQILEKINEDPETAFDFFKEKWKKLTIDDKKLFCRCRNTPVIIPYVHNKHHFSQNDSDKSYLITVCTSLIDDYIVNELNEKSNIRQYLRCGENIGPVDIACVFKLLKDLKYLDNTLEEIEEVIAPLFNLNQNTIRSYLKEPGKLKKSAKQFKKLVDESSLVKL